MEAVIQKFLQDLRPKFEEGDLAVSNKTAEASCMEIVERIYQAVARGDFPAFSDALADDVELENVGPPAVPFVGKWRGRTEVCEAVVRNFSYMGDQQPVVRKVVAQGDTVVVEARERGTFRPTGREYDVHWVQIFTCRDGRLVRFLQIFDAAGLLKAIEG